MATPEQRGEDVSGRLIFAPEDAISLSLEYLPSGADPLELLTSDPEGCSSKPKSGISRRYLQCPALVTIAHLKKFLALKYTVDVTKFNIDICHRQTPLPEHWTLMDVAYIFAWKRVSLLTVEAFNLVSIIITIIFIVSECPNKIFLSYNTRRIIPRGSTKRQTFDSGIGC